MGDFADGPDLPDRLQWAKALHIHCTLPSSDITSEIDIQLHLYSLVQALQECQAKVLQASERSAHLVKIAKTAQDVGAPTSCVRHCTPTLAGLPRGRSAQSCWTKTHQFVGCIVYT